MPILGRGERRRDIIGDLGRYERKDRRGKEDGERDDDGEERGGKKFDPYRVQWR